MAYLNKQHCRKCGKETQHNHNDCLTCQARDRKAAEQAWSAQSLDEKLLDLHRRLLAVERGPARY